MKVFDCQDMPDDVRTYLFESSYQGNDCYVSQEVFGPTYFDEDSNTDIECEEYNIVCQWLLDNGATIGEYVIISHWW